MGYTITNTAHCTECGTHIIFKAPDTQTPMEQGILHELHVPNNTCCGFTYKLKQEYRFTVHVEKIYELGWYVIKKIESGASGEEAPHPARLHSDGEWYSFYRDKYIDIKEYKIIKPLNVGVE